MSALFEKLWSRVSEKGVGDFTLKKSDVGDDLNRADGLLDLVAG